MVDAANHIFLPWVQPGVAANIPDQATERLTADQPAAISLPVRLVVNDDAVEKTARLYGPGDITGIDPQQVVRVEPRHRTTDFEPNYFPAIEFDRPDFPWLFTPAKADAQARLRPWLCLVVVRKQPGVEFRPPESEQLPVLEIKTPARPADELPDLSESHLWSHAQITGVDKSQIKTALESAPARTVSRLLCPRRLDPTTEYIACVVPAFEVGRKAGLNETTEEDKLKPAWLSGSEAPAEITLPVYYAWEFRTAAGGDFEELVRRLEPRELPQEVGKRPMDISRPGFTMQPQPPPDAEGTTLGLEGALRVVGSEADNWPPEVREPFQTALATILNLPWELATNEGADVDQDPILGPPIYGCWHAAAHKVGAPPVQQPPPSEQAPPWLNELNLDPRNRAVAAMGTQVVQERQEQLMASAWEQLGDIEKINQRLRQAQLSRAVNERYHVKTFARLPEEVFVRIVAPAKSRVVVEEQAPNQPPVRSLLVQKLAGSFVPSTVVSAPLRKMTRPRGTISRQFAQAGTISAPAMFTLFSTATPQPPGPTTQNRGAVTVDDVSDNVLATVDQVRGFIWNPLPPPHWERIRTFTMPMLNTFRLSHLGSSAIVPGPPLGALNPPSHEFVEAAIRHQGYLSLVFIRLTFETFAPLSKPISALEIKAAVLISLNPARAVSQAVLAGVKINSPSSLGGDELDQVMDSPTFPQPMYEALRDLSQDYLFPGLEHVPPNTVQLLQTNGKFIESFMVGLNAEMSRELLWRDYPTNQRGTYFQQFWDTAAAGAQAQLDITPIHQWGNRELGTTAVGAEGDKLVLLIRGELLRRYPGTVIYAVKAVLQADGKRDLSTDPAEERHPVFRGTLEPDVNFLGFDLTPEEVVADTGWFFVLQQQPTEPRFGLDADPFGEGESGVIPELKTWNDLNWAHVAPSAEKLKELSHVSASTIELAPTEPVKGSWGRNSAHMAYITKQLPARVAIHATELLP